MQHPENMSTLTIELPDETARLAAEKAGQVNLTLAEWVSLRIAGRSRVRAATALDDMGYPSGWFEHTAGSLAEVEDFREPDDFSELPVGPLEP